MMGILQTCRDKKNFLFGVFIEFIAVMIIALFKNETTRKAIKKWAFRITPIYISPWNGRIINDLMGKEPPLGAKKLWPPNHPGGKPELVYDWAYSELIVKQGLSSAKAWKPFTIAYPKMDNEDPLMSDTCKQKFLDAMRYRRRKDKKKGVKLR